MPPGYGQEATQMFSQRINHFSLAKSNCIKDHKSTNYSPVLFIVLVFI
jgi:hypothetical protein